MQQTKDDEDDEQANGHDKHSRTNGTHCKRGTIRRLDG
jgi:hypothetical protein